MPTKNAKRSTSFIRLLLAGRCSQRHPCTGAQNGANSPLGFRLQTRPKRRKSHPGARRRRGPLALSLAGWSTMVYRKGQPRRKGTGYPSAALLRQPSTRTLLRGATSEPFGQAFATGRRHWTPCEITGTLLVTRRVSPRRNPLPPAIPAGLPRGPKVFRFSYTPNHESEPNMIKQLRAAAAIAILAAAGATAVRAQEVTQAEKDRAVQYLEKTKQGVLDATKGLSEAQWNFKAGPDRWSIAQVMEHIAAAEDYIRGLVVEKVMVAPAVPDRDLKKTDDMVMAMIPDRSQKAQAPEPLVPTNRYNSPEGSVNFFLDSRATTENFVKSTPGLRDHAIDSPMGMKLDGYQFVLLIAAHSERHTKQILEVKADPNYPKD